MAGVSEGKAVLLWTGYDEEIIPSDEYIRQAVENGGNAKDAENDWFKYLEERRVNKILIADLKSGGTTEIASGKNEKLLLLVDPDVVYKGALYYYYDGALMSYSLRDGKTKELLRTPDVINVFAKDGRVFYITRKAGGASFCYYVLESGESHEIVNEGNNDVMVFPPHEENSTMFMGSYKEKRHLISKEDYYKEDYNKAVKID